MRGVLNPLASNELLGCPGLAPPNLRLANIFQKPRKPRLCRTKHSTGKYPPNNPTIQASFSVARSSFGISPSSDPTVELTGRRDFTQPSPHQI
jgi:hypothetical protein